MIGPYYRPQLTSMLSIAHRATGVLLSIAGVPLVLCWLAALNGGPEAFAALNEKLASLPGVAVLTVLAFSLWFHFFNGIRHLVWDTGRWLSLPGAYRSGWAVLALSVVGTIAVLGVLL